MKPRTLLCCLSLAAFLLPTLASCGTGLGPQDTVDRYEMPTVTEEAVLRADGLIRTGDVYRNLFYFGYDQTDGLYTLDIVTGEINLFNDEIKNPGLVATDADGILVWDVTDISLPSTRS